MFQFLKKLRESNQPDSIFETLRLATTPHEYDKEILDLIYLVLSKEKDDSGQHLVKLTQLVFEKLGYITVNNDGYNDQGKDILVFSKNDSQEPMLHKPIIKD